MTHIKAQLRNGVQRTYSTIEALSSSAQKLDVRAHQRTYEGAYTRSALSALSFSLMVVKLFSPAFLPIAMVYTIYGSLLYFVGVSKAGSVDTYYNPKNGKEEFVTGATTVIVLTAISLVAYVAIFVLILRL